MPQNVIVITEYRKFKHKTVVWHTAFFVRFGHYVRQAMARIGRFNIGLSLAALNRSAFWCSV